MEHLPTYLNEEEYKKLLSQKIKPHHKLAFILAFDSGLRVSEIVNLKPQDIDMTGKRIFIKSGKGDKDRVVPLPKRFSSYWWTLLPIKCGVRALQLAFSNAIKKAQLDKPNLHFHSLRHSFAVRGMEKGIPLNQIQVLLGHSNISTTNIYTKVNPQDALANYERLW